jgi:hypothetical protein
VTTRTLSMVKSSHRIPRHPEVPKLMRAIHFLLDSIHLDAYSPKQQ